MTAHLERAILERAYARISCVTEYRVENRPEFYGQRRRPRGIPNWVGSVVLVAGRPSLLDELAPFAAREQLRRALDIARAADLAALFHQIDAGDVALLRARARIVVVLEAYAQPSHTGKQPRITVNTKANQ